MNRRLIVVVVAMVSVGAAFWLLAPLSVDGAKTPCTGVGGVPRWFGIERSGAEANAREFGMTAIEFARFDLEMAKDQADVSRGYWKRIDACNDAGLLRLFYAGGLTIVTLVAAGGVAWATRLRYADDGQTTETFPAPPTPPQATTPL